MIFFLIPALLTFAGAIINTLQNGSCSPGWWIGLIVGIVIDLAIAGGGEAIGDIAESIGDSIGDIDFD